MWPKYIPWNNDNYHFIKFHKKLYGIEYALVIKDNISIIIAENEYNGIAASIWDPNTLPKAMLTSIYKNLWIEQKKVY